MKIRNTLLAEKREPDDKSPLAAALRGVEEKLGISMEPNTTQGLEHDPDADETFTDRKESASYPSIPAIYLTHYVYLRVREGTNAAELFRSFGIEDGSFAFTTQEQKQDVVIQSVWEWVDIREARTTGVKGFVGGAERRGSLISLTSDVAESFRAETARV